MSHSFYIDSCCQLLKRTFPQILAPHTGRNLVFSSLGIKFSNLKLKILKFKLILCTKLEYRLLISIKRLNQWCCQIKKVSTTLHGRVEFCNKSKWKFSKIDPLSTDRSMTRRVHHDHLLLERTREFWSSQRSIHGLPISIWSSSATNRWGEENIEQTEKKRYFWQTWRSLSRFCVVSSSVNDLCWKENWRPAQPREMFWRQ